MNIKQLKRLALAQAQVSGQEVDEPLGEHCGTGRSFRKRKWALGAGPLVLEALGWDEEYERMVRDEDEEEEVSGAGASRGGPPASRAAHAVPDRTTPDPVPTASHTPRPLPQEGGEAGGAALEEIGTEGMDTPIHRAAVRAFDKALEALAETLKVSVAGVKGKLRQALMEEEMFKRQFNNLMSSLYSSIA